MLTHVLKRFPQWREKIEQLFCDDPDFRALCCEYEETTRTLAFWIQLERLPHKRIDQQKQDCQEALQEMETDILFMLDRQFPSPENGATTASENSEKK